MSLPYRDDARRSYRLYALVLGTVCAMGPLGLDMYLPGVPTIAREMAVSEGTVQISLMGFFVGLASGQLFYGPVSDRLGRRGPLCFGIVLFIAASVGCALTRQVETLIVLRTIQGLGGCAGMVLARAVIRDISTGNEAVRLFAFTLLVLGVMPIVAPFIGSLFVLFLHWTAIFWFYAAFGLCCLALVVFLLPETAPREDDRAARLRDAFARYGRLVRDGRFIGLIALLGAAKGGFYAYLAGAPFLFMTLHHLAPWFYGLIFGANAIALLAGQQLSARLVGRFTVGRVVALGIAGFFASAGVLVLMQVLGMTGLVLIVVVLFVCIGFLGLIFPPTIMLAMEPHGAQAGAASAVIGTGQFAAGAMASGLVSLFFDGTDRSLVGVIAGCAVVAVVLARGLAKRLRWRSSVVVE